MENDQQAIDIVITWVDGNDVQLKQKRQDYLSESIASSASSSTRFASNDEIYFCIASVLKYMSNLGTIYIVTDQQKPRWIEEFAKQGICSEDKIKIIDHTVIFKDFEEYLPTFNSLSINTLIWNIPELSERIMYFNDDIFITQPLDISDGFIEEKIIIYGAWKSKLLPKMKYLIRNMIYRWLNKSAEPKFTIAQMLGADKIGLSRYYTLEHRPHFLKKSILQQYFMVHPQYLIQQIHHKFRHIDQFSPISLANHLAIQQGKAILKPNIPIAYLRPQDNVEQFLREITDESIKFGCIQSLDMMTLEQRKQIQQGMVDKFDSFLPQQVKTTVIQ